VIFCKACGSEMASIFSLGAQPLANKYPKSCKEFAEEIIKDLNVFFCSDCCYCYLPCDIERALFFEDYYYLSSVNTELKRHFEKLADQIALKKPRFVLDVGSNDGILLEPLRLRNISCVGIDPSANVAAIANAAGNETIVGFFDTDVTKPLRERHGRPDIIVASSVFTHFENPYDFFDVSNGILAANGEIIIEVEYLGNILSSLGFERFYFDRPHYYSIKSLSVIAERSGFKLIKTEKIQPHGGSIRAWFKRSTETDTESSIEAEIFDETQHITTNNFLEYFRLFRLECEKLKNALYLFHKDNLRVVAYGCPARFSTITNFADIDHQLIPAVIDDSPLKSGRFSPGKHVPIVAYDSSTRFDICLVFAYEYIESIKMRVRTGSPVFYKPIPFTPI